MADRKHNYRLNEKDKKTVEAAFKQLRKYDAEITAARDDMKVVWKSLKDQGFNVKALRDTFAATKRRDADPEKFDEYEQARDVFYSAFGLI